MSNKLAKEYWEKKAGDNPTPTTIKVNAVNDFTQTDADFIMQFADSSSSILDLASGTGLTINKYYNKVKHIVAVELCKQFSDFIVKSPNVEIVNCDLTQFETVDKFDVINMFGIVSYFDEKEITKLYKKYKEYMKPNGILLIKNQFGVTEDVVVNGYSEELKTDYYSEYRHIDKEVEILKSIGYKNIRVIDIYPPEANRWSNTHFYAIVANL